MLTKINQEQLFSISQGSGDALIFIPGWCMTTRCFEKQLDFFSKDYHCIVYDPRGQGRSTTLGEYTNIQRGIDLKQVIDEYQLNTVTLIGWSDGYFAICSYLQQFGFAKVKSIVNIDRPPKGVKELDTDYAFATFADEKYVYHSALNQNKEFFESFIKDMLPNESKNIPQQFLNDAMTMPPARAAQLIADNCFQDYSEITIEAAKQVPFLHIADDSRSEMGRAWCRANIPQAQFYTFGTHMMFWNEAQKFNAVLHEFLKAR